MAGSEMMADVIRTWQADAAPNSTDQIPSGRFLTEDYQPVGMAYSQQFWPTTQWKI